MSTNAPLVLLVDDNELVVEALRTLLDATGHRVRTAGSVAEAIAAAREEVPAVALVDLTLPDGDGLTIVRALASESPAPRAIVALTGHDDPDVAVRCREAGCREVFVKPVRPAVLIAALGAWLAE